VKRKSKLGVLVRLARLEESNRLRAFGQARGALERLDQQLHTTQERIADAGTASSLHGEGSTEAAYVRGAHVHYTALRAETSRLSFEREKAFRKLQLARQELAQAHLRTQAIEDADRRRRDREARARRKREAQRLEEAHRHSGGEGPDALE